MEKAYQSILWGSDPKVNGGPPLSCGFAKSSMQLARTTTCSDCESRVHPVTRVLISERGVVFRQRSCAGGCGCTTRTVFVTVYATGLIFGAETRAEERRTAHRQPLDVSKCDGVKAAVQGGVGGWSPRIMGVCSRNVGAPHLPEPPGTSRLYFRSRATSFNPPAIIYLYRRHHTWSDVERA